MLVANARQTVVQRNTVIKNTPRRTFSFPSADGGEKE